MALAIIAGRGALPGILARARTDAVIVTIEGVAAEVPEVATKISASFEKLGRLFSDLRAAGVTEVVMAGGMDRPALNPAKFDLKMIKLAPSLMMAFRQGDDGLLRKVIGIFEAEGFRIVGVGEVAPGLVAQQGQLAGKAPDKTMAADAARGWAILDAIGPLDVGQAAVVAGGLCLGIETVQGTDALIAFAGATPKARRPEGGVLVKGPKPGQELRVDMPAIGPGTVERAAEAGLKGIALAAGSVLVLDSETVEARARALGLSIWAEAR